MKIWMLLLCLSFLVSVTINAEAIKVTLTTKELCISTSVLSIEPMISITSYINANFYCINNLFKDNKNIFQSGVFSLRIKYSF